MKNGYGNENSLLVHSGSNLKSKEKEKEFERKKKEKKEERSGGEPVVAMKRNKGAIF